MEAPNHKFSYVFAVECVTPEMTRVTSPPSVPPLNRNLPNNEFPPGGDDHLLHEHRVHVALPQREKQERTTHLDLRLGYTKLIKRLFRAGRPICRKVLKIMFGEVPPADWLIL